MRIDSHQHFWDRTQPFKYGWLDSPSAAPIKGNFLPKDLAPLLAASGFDRCVTVQTQHDPRENDWALALADAHPNTIAGVVGWVDLAAPECGRQLEHARRHPKFVGVRHGVQDEPDDDFIVRPDVLRGLGELARQKVPFDMLFLVRHLKHAATLADRFPALPLVIDHLAKPRVKAKALADWLPALKAAAARPNVHCKLSGLATEADWKTWTAADLKPYVQEALSAFGPQRCMFGSDWPVCLLAGKYETIHAALKEALGPLSKDDDAAIFGGTAARFYGLS
jgi:L-fuconolactonase